ncbi:sulfite exporter TauE/SafE family protein [Magnetospirillum molischianum]|uniref:Probable membrane transporter protein n=1 Tax=Magnetospirillum molischianum DSM 120 TaxID=1150626 RepID=H8FVQ9_MAGML|nr:sulfite exporter TauE/SafE family protein [Magnetospirillum molischianum]CCG42447.1 putative permease; putative membrane protein [Magnetospirillum molischianum DSM 120]
MQIYLPIAEMSVNVFVILAVGGGIGFLSGLFGAGGGFLLTPLLIFLGVPPAVAVGTGTNQIVASSVSGALAQWRRGNVDLRMGLILILGGLVGSGLGVLLFHWLRRLGHIDLVISASYVVLLGGIGGLMVTESVRELLRRRAGGGTEPIARRHARGWIDRLPLKVRFRRSHLYISALLPALVGIAVGVISAIMGVGGGFVLVPAMIYLLGMPTAVVMGTSLFQIVFVTANATFLHATVNHTVDVVLALVLVLGGAIGAQFGVRVGARLKGEHLRVLLGLLVLAVAVKLLIDLLVPPTEPFSLAATIGAAR